MNKLNSLLLLATFLIISCATPTTSEIGKVAIIPQPAQQSIGEGFFGINKNTTILVEDETQAKIARFLFSTFKEKSGWIPYIVIGE